MIQRARLRSTSGAPWPWGFLTSVRSQPLLWPRTCRKQAHYRPKSQAALGVCLGNHSITAEISNCWEKNQKMSASVPSEGQLGKRVEGTRGERRVRTEAETEVLASLAGPTSQQRVQTGLGQWEEVAGLLTCSPVPQGKKQVWKVP